MGKVNPPPMEKGKEPMFQRENRRAPKYKRSVFPPRMREGKNLLQPQKTGKEKGIKTVHRIARKNVRKPAGKGDKI